MALVSWCQRLRWINEQDASLPGDKADEASYPLCMYAPWKAWRTALTLPAASELLASIGQEISAEVLYTAKG